MEVMAEKSQSPLKITQDCVITVTGLRIIEFVRWNEDRDGWRCLMEQSNAKPLKRNNKMFKSISYLTGNQCNDTSTVVIHSCFFVPVRSLTSAFWNSCKHDMIDRLILESCSSQSKRNKSTNNCFGS